jgi:hypothetical protein
MDGAGATFRYIYFSFICVLLLSHTWSHLIFLFSNRKNWGKSYLAFRNIFFLFPHFFFKFYLFLFNGEKHKKFLFSKEKEKHPQQKKKIPNKLFWRQLLSATAIKIAAHKNLSENPKKKFFFKSFAFHHVRTGFSLDILFIWNFFFSLCGRRGHSPPPGLAHLIVIRR